MTNSQYCFPVDLGKGLELNRENIQKYYDHTELEYDEGFYPLGLATHWHGALHILHQTASQIHACADGEVVAVLLSSDLTAQEKLSRGRRTLRFGGNNFILLRHTFHDKTEKKKEWYSIYYNLRYEKLTENPETLKTASWIEKAKLTDSKIETGLLAIDQVLVKKGELLWTMEKNINHEQMGMIHWAIFSEELLYPDWDELQDPHQDKTDKLDSLLKQIGLNQEGYPKQDEIINFYQNNSKALQLRHLACRFVNEWAKDMTQYRKKSIAMGDKFLTPPKFHQPYLWWQEAKRSGVALPGTPYLWHYNPIAFLERLDEESKKPKPGLFSIKLTNDFEQNLTGCRWQLTTKKLIPVEKKEKETTSEVKEKKEEEKKDTTPEEKEIILAEEKLNKNGRIDVDIPDQSARLLLKLYPFDPEEADLYGLPEDSPYREPVILPFSLHKELPKLSEPDGVPTRLKNLGLCTDTDENCETGSNKPGEEAFKTIFSITETSGNKQENREQLLKTIEKKHDN